MQNLCFLMALGDPRERVVRDPQVETGYSRTYRDHTGEGRVSYSWEGAAGGVLNLSGGWLVTSPLPVRKYQHAHS